MSDDTVVIRGTIRAAGPWTLVGFDDRQPDIPSWPPGVIAIDGDLTRQLVTLTYDGKVYQIHIDRFGWWPKQWHRVVTKRAANPIQRQWFARHTFNRIARQARSD